jgi:hypothetical protein
MNPPRRAWLTDVVVGGLAGAVVGGMVAVNLVSYYGVFEGQEASLAGVFERSVLLGVTVAGALLAGPIVGVLTAHMQRVKQSRGGPHSH